MHSNGNKLLSYNLWLFSALVTFCECLVCDVDYVEVVLLLSTKPIIFSAGDVLHFHLTLSTIEIKIRKIVGKVVNLTISTKEGALYSINKSCFEHMSFILSSLFI